LKNTTKTLFILSLLVLPGTALLAPPALAQESGPVFELRTYTATPGNLDALLARFRDHTLELFEKHGMHNVGYWVPTDPARSRDTLIYVLRHESREAADASWQAFLNDPEWERVAAESNADGQILRGVERVYMRATDFSPMQ